MSIVICRPLVASVSSTLDVVADVVSDTDDRSWSPVTQRSAARCTVSPGTSPAALTDILFAGPDAPSAMLTVPVDTDVLADVVEVNVPNVPRPATAAAAPTADTVVRTFPLVALL